MSRRLPRELLLNRGYLQVGDHGRTVRNQCLIPVRILDRCQSSILHGRIAVEDPFVPALIRDRNCVSRDCQGTVVIQFIDIGVGTAVLVIMPCPVAVGQLIIGCGFGSVFQLDLFQRLRIVQPPAVPIPDIRCQIVCVVNVGKRDWENTVGNRGVRVGPCQVAREIVDCPRPGPARALAVIGEPVLKSRTADIDDREIRMSRIGGIVIGRSVFRVPVGRFLPRFQQHAEVLQRIRVPKLHKVGDIELIELVLPAGRSDCRDMLAFNGACTVRLEAAPGDRAEIPCRQDLVQVDLLIVRAGGCFSVFSAPFGRCRAR